MGLFLIYHLYDKIHLYRLIKIDLDYLDLYILNNSKDLQIILYT